MMDFIMVVVDDDGHVHKTLFHGYIRDICTPYLVGPSYIKVLEQIQLDKRFQARFGQVLTPVYRIPAHEPEQSTDTLWTYDKAHTHQ